MAIDMTTVKAISYNNKDVVKIEDSLGHILWQVGTPVVDLFYVSSQNTSTYQYEKTNDTVSSKTWTMSTGSNRPVASQIWYDGTEIRWNTNNYTWTLNTSTDTWTRASSGIALNGGDIWSDGTNIYAGSISAQYVYDKVNKTWSTYTWGTPVDGITKPAGWKIWSDGTNFLCSPANDNDRVYKLDTNTNAWEYYFTSNITIDTRCTWSPDGGNTIYRSQTNSPSGTYKYDKINHTWTQCSNVPNYLVGANIFKYNNKIYAANGTDHYLYELTIDTTTDTITGVQSNMYISSFNSNPGCAFWDLNGKRTLSMWPTPHKSNT